MTQADAVPHKGIHQPEEHKMHFESCCLKSCIVRLFWLSFSLSLLVEDNWPMILNLDFTLYYTLLWAATAFFIVLVKITFISKLRKTFGSVLTENMTLQEMPSFKCLMVNLSILAVLLTFLFCFVDFFLLNNWEILYMDCVIFGSMSIHKGIYQKLSIKKCFSI